jgi:class 3 adenylate cyclase
MTKSVLHTLAEVPIVTSWDYFWDMLPYAVPGLITFATGVFLALICLIRFFKEPAEKRDRMYRDAAMMLFGFGMLGLIFSMRAVVRDEVSLLSLNNRVQWLGSLIFPGTVGFVLRFLGNRHKALKFWLFLGWGLVLLCLVTGLPNLFFLNDWTYFSFGKYPKGSIFAKIWTLVGAIGSYHIFVLLVLNWKNKRTRGEKLIIAGICLLIILTTSNGPSQLGIRFFPLGVFNFIPMFLVLAGILLSDFLSVNEFLFNRSGLFYTVTFFIALIFLSLAITVALGIRPSYFVNIDLTFYLVTSVISLIAVLVLAITIAGIDPRSRVNQLAAAFLFSVGLLEIIIVLSAIRLPILYSFRIQQLIYLLFVFAPALGLHAMYAVYNIRVHKLVYAIDVLVVICAILALTPWYYSGMYAHSFGSFAAAGPGGDLFAATSAVAIGFAITVWNRQRKQTENKQATYIVLSFILVGMLIITSVPALQGIDIFPLSGMLILPAILLAYGLSKHGPLTLHGHAFAINRRMAIFLVLFITIAMTLVMVILREQDESRAGILYAIFLVIPLFLFGYLILFLFTKPLTMNIDSNFDELRQEKEVSNHLLLNILPSSVAEELKLHGEVKPVYYEAATIMFTDFVGFTHTASRMQPQELIEQLNRIFFQFDAISQRYQIEKIKTIGDSYMAAGGLPQTNTTHALDVCLAALEIRQMTKQLLELLAATGGASWQLRIGIHTGPVMAGIVGQHKYAYDIFGDSVNIASRLESTGEPGEINISETTYEQVKFFFDCEHRGSLPMKNHGDMEMYFLQGIKSKFLNPNGSPNDRFREIHNKLKAGARLVPRT